MEPVLANSVILSSYNVSQKFLYIIRLLELTTYTTCLVYLMERKILLQH